MLSGLIDKIYQVLLRSLILAGRHRLGKSLTFGLCGSRHTTDNRGENLTCKKYVVSCLGILAKC